MDAFILAAGRGERLRPLTDELPKPLLRVGERSLIEHHLHALKRAGFERIIINHAWLGDKIVATLGDGCSLGLRLHYSAEPEGALETAGGVVNALDLITSDIFTLVSADIRTDFDFSSLGLEDDADMHLVMVANPAHHAGGDFSVVDGRLRQVAATGSAYTYAGIGCFRKSLFQHLEPGHRRLRHIIESCIASGRAAATIFQGRWMDVGTRQRLAEAERLFLPNAEHP